MKNQLVNFRIKWTVKLYKIENNNDLIEAH